MIMMLLIAMLGLPSTALGATSDGYGPWADSYRNFTQGLKYNDSTVDTNRSNPQEALGEAETTGTPTDTPTSPPTWLSLGFGGTVTLEFEGSLRNGENEDLMVYEVTGGTYPDEAVKVEASYNGTAWVVLADNVSRDAKLSLPDYLPCARYVRVTDVSDKALFTTRPDADGYDLDAVKAYYPSEESCDLESSLLVEKSVDLETVIKGDEVTYTYNVTNTGDFALTDVEVEDDKCSPVEGPEAAGDENGDGKLTPEETWVYTCSTVLEESTTNTVYVTAVDPFENEITDEDSLTVEVTLGCVYSQGYWKTHSENDEDKYDERWKNAMHFDEVGTWEEVLETAPKKGNAWYILAHQYIAAYLNNVSAYMPEEVLQTLESAAELLNANEYGSAPSKTERGEYLKYAEILENYNTGGYEVPHCE